MALSARESQNPSNNNFFVFHLSLFILFIFELLSGVFLSTLYRPSSPYETTRDLHQGLFRLVQSFHYWASAFLIFFGLLLIAFDLWTARYGRRERVTFTALVLIWLASLGFQLSGNLLPFDRHGVQTATIEAAIAARIPLVGETAQGLLLGGPGFQPKTVQIWFALHLGLTVVAVIALALAWKGIKSVEGKTPWGKSVLASAAVLALGLCVASPFGSKATTDDYNGFADRASWYTQPLHGSLTMMSRLSPSLGWIGAVVIPGLCVGALLLIPWLAPKLSHKVIRSGMAVAALYFLIAALFFGGSFDSLTGPRDPIVAVGDAKSGTPIDAQLAAKGKVVFNSASVGCSSCHGTNGVNGKSGPSLKDVYKTHPDADFYIKYVKNPVSQDPNSTMPAFGDLPADQLKQIAEYLRAPTKP